MGSDSHEDDEEKTSGVEGSSSEVYSICTGGVEACLQGVCGREACASGDWGGGGTSMGQGGQCSHGITSHSKSGSEATRRPGSVDPVPHLCGRESGIVI